MERQPSEDGLDGLSASLGSALRQPSEDGADASAAARTPGKPLLHSGSGVAIAGGNLSYGASATEVEMEEGVWGYDRLE
jgi:hypothetical protein